MQQTLKSLLQRPGSLRGVRSMSTSRLPPALKTIFLPAKDPQHQIGTVIFLHGLGDTGAGWLSGMEFLQSHNPNIKFILPTAPIRPVTWNGGAKMPAWYDIRNIANRTNEDFEGLEQSKQTVWELIDAEIAAGTPSSKIILGGFSQGGAMSLHAGYRYSAPLAGLLLLSCYLPVASKLATEIHPSNNKTEFVMFHGEEDEIVAPEWAQTSFDRIQEVGGVGRFQFYPDMGHEASHQELMDCMTFINKKLKSVPL